MAATDDASVAFADDVDAVVYTATADTRPDDAFADLDRVPARPGANVVSTSFYPLLHPASAPAPLLDAVERACADGRHVGVRVGHRPGLGARHPARPA